ncbi:hypothetical protein KY284_030488 [Solanum tuberosum]|nr:hypothetical protein KY284_030488 [Solanum tuberosum]
MEYLKGTQRISLEDMQAMSYVGKQTIATPQPCIMQSLVRKSSLQLEIIEEEQQPLDVPPTMNFPAEMMMMINTHHVNNNNNIVENQLEGMQGMMMIDQNNMLFDDHPQPMCYFVPVVTPTNYFHHHHHQYPMLPTHAPPQRGQYYYEMDHQFHLPNNNMK